MLVNSIKSCSMAFPLVGRRRIGLHGWMALAAACGLQLSIYAKNLPDEARIFKRVS
jgi:hypothetical protein